MSVVHRVYARALFEAAQERGRIREVDADLTEFLESTRQVPELAAVLGNRELDSQAKAELIGAVLEGADELVRNFVQLAIEKGRERDLDEIASAYNDLLKQELGFLKVDLTTAVHLSDEEARPLIDQIGEATGRTVEATMTVDPELIGGVVLQIGSMRVDASVRGRLERLRHELATGA
jgi:F-type H+-transporting ATPase subunit delta